MQRMPTPFTYRKGVCGVRESFGGNRGWELRWGHGSPHKLQVIRFVVAELAFTLSCTRMTPYAHTRRNRRVVCKRIMRPIGTHHQHCCVLCAESIHTCCGGEAAALLVPVSIGVSREKVEVNCVACAELRSLQCTVSKVRFAWLTPRSKVLLTKRRCRIHGRSVASISRLADHTHETS